jgi:DNA-binding IclR family transcriptional regulator
MEFIEYLMVPIQTSRKIFAVLRALATADEGGLSLADLHAATALPKPTLHRLLAILAEQGMAMRAGAGRRYKLGPELFALALRAHASINLVARWRPALLRIVEQTGDSAFLMVRSGYDAVCLAREDGMIQIRTLTNTIGGRVPLGIGQGSAAILAGLAPDECAAILRHNAPRLRLFDPTSERRAHQAVAAVRAHGYVHGGGTLLADVAGVAVPVPTPPGMPACALSVASIQARLEGGRLADIVRLMQDAVAAIVQAGP